MLGLCLACLDFLNLAMFQENQGKYNSAPTLFHVKVFRLTRPVSKVDIKMQTKVLILLVVLAIAKFAPVEAGRQGCDLSTEQRACMAIQAGILLISQTACATKSECETAFTKLNNFAKGACGISLSFLCDPNLCPENKGKTSCANFGKGGDFKKR